MKITLESVQLIFLDILEDRLTREEADRWAQSVIREDETGCLEFSPPEEKMRIWSGVMYLYGIDIQEETGKYLHTKDDIRTALHEKIGCN